MRPHGVSLIFGPGCVFWTTKGQTQKMKPLLDFETPYYNFAKTGLEDLVISWILGTFEYQFNVERHI